MLGDRIPKKLFQSALTASAATYYTGVTNKRTQLTSLWITNTNTTTTRFVTLYAYGTSVANVLAQKLEIAPEATVIIRDALVFLATETFSAKQNTGTDVTITAYGIEEDLV